MKLGRFASVTVLAVFLVIGFVSYVTLFVFLRDHGGLRSSAVYGFLALYCLFCFIVCLVMEPGQVPSHYVPDVEGEEIPGHEPGKNVANPRRCDSCCRQKPPRCHHCRLCRSCVLKMDHHCRWINNCIGHWNYKAFFNLVLFATLASCYSSVVFITRVYEKGWHFPGSSTANFVYVTSGLVLLGLSLVLASFLGWHVYLIAHNLTTIEYYEGVRARWLAKKSGQSYSHPFDLGIYRNVLSILGPNVLLWFWPTAVGHLRDGTNFQVSRND
ncbi:hypothetical protein MLD38_008645 [Melastoma candidum]|uniref:Uncharacterized protein n=1 Tax=Melastoma candidum TaxID=119954 RepID=A0ACB9RWD8_9MYRT|nr:hypothetical protein MLD38_008645 [Melastoma candidum]